jgi:glycosyltransferase involved in cell wall biosynthesis
VKSEKLILPKVLILNQPFNNETGGGITLTNLFSSWDKDKIAVVCPAYLINSRTQGTICCNYYQLGSKEHWWALPFRLMARKYASGPIEIKAKNDNNLTVKKSATRVNFIKNYLNPFLNKLGLSHGISKYHLSPELKKWIDQFNPDVIYAQAQRRENLLFCNTIQQYLGKPMVFHMMDDWVEFVPKGKYLGKDWHKQIDEDFKLVLGNSVLHLSISDLMAKEYSRRYGYEFQAYHNPINSDFWKKGQKNTYELSSSPEILYAGRLGLGINESLKLMANAISFLNKKLNLSMKFVIQSSQSEDWMGDFDVISHRPFVAYSELPFKFGEADFLYLPYEFSSEAIKYFQLSMPTKASEYMICGTPIVIVAPRQTALVKYAERYAWAEIVTSNRLEDLIDALELLLKDKERRRKIGETAISTAEKRHDGNTVRKEFMNQLALLSGFSIDR